MEGSLDDFVEYVHQNKLPRVPGVAVFPHPDRLTTPLALRDNVEFNHVMHERVVIVSIVNENVPHIHHVDRATAHELGYGHEGIVHVQYRVGFNDSQDVPKAIYWSHGKAPELDFNPDEARYFVSVLRLSHKGTRTLRTWRKQLFLWLAGNAANQTAVFHLPPERTIVMGGHLEV